jgi:uncharacterized protein YjiS (DUF1127 family)
MELYFSPLGGVLPNPRRSQHGGSLWDGWHGRFSAPRVLAVLKRWRRRAYERRVLAQFSERDRRDLALTAADIQREITKPFWRG